MNTILLLFALLTKPSYIPIAAARAQAQGTVTVMGLVTVPSGRFRSSSEDEGFALNDQTGGIWVSVAKNLHLHRGERVLVTGTLGTGAGKLQINAEPAQIRRLPGRALRVATGSIGTATLGDIVTIEGMVTTAPQKDESYGWKMWVDDGTGAAMVYLNASTDIDAHARYLRKGRRIRVTGFGNQYNTSFEVDPRGRQDLQALK
jgi:DNA/RNA endonuclease YhcR with UshA esterase domain